MGMEGLFWRFYCWGTPSWWNSMATTTQNVYRGQAAHNL